MALLRRIGSLGRQARLEHEIDAELREHIPMCIDDNIVQGMSREEAERDARLRFANPTAMRERVFAEDDALGSESLWHDRVPHCAFSSKAQDFPSSSSPRMRLASVPPRQSSNISTGAVALPIAKSGELAEVRIAGGNRGFGVTDNYFINFTVPMREEVKQHHDHFSGVFACRTSDVKVGSSNQSRRVSGLEISGDFFSVLGVPQARGV